MTTYTTDSFNRGDSASNLGTTDGAGTLDPLTWVQDTGTLGISSNQAYASALTSSLAIAHVELSKASVDLSIKVATEGGGAGALFRYSATTDYWMWHAGGDGNSYLYKVVGSTPTQVGATQSGAVNGDVYRVVAHGDVIQVYRNGILKITAFDSFNNTATKHGMFIQGTTAALLDDWSVTTLAHVAPLTNTIEISGGTTKLVAIQRALTDAVQISAIRQISRGITKNNTIQISNAFSLKRVTLLRTRTNTLNISATRVVARSVRLSNTLSISNTTGVIGVFVQLDTWRPVAKPTDNSLMLVCRSPEGLHDTPAGLEEMSLWTIRPDGTDEHPVLLNCQDNGYGWLRQAHQEWSPNGMWVVIGVETASEYKLFIINSSAYGL